jgi:hypothetical protein
MDNLLADTRRAARVLSASPGMVLVSVVPLGLGLGANLTLFSFLRAAFFYDRGQLQCVQARQSRM